ncbi:hypothetical protein HF521_017791 [Silurus meridionalis]|uniref:Uncharacterized protein n=1 Tax=Silurus meridionalis TaxID=175797 RepID=A0A8T0BNZ3_SILME|nr:hypothetical protein HF521_017791 [Silurus meridionalis]
MISNARVFSDDYKYPNKHEVIAMAKHLLPYDNRLDLGMSAKHPHFKRACQGSVPSVASDYNADSSASTVNLSPPSTLSIPRKENDSINEACKYYRTLQVMYKENKPNKPTVTHLLDLEFKSSRNFIDSYALKEQDRPTKILQAYLCFKELDHNHCQYIPDVNSRWETFNSKVQLYGMMKKDMKPKRTLNRARSLFMCAPHTPSPLTALPLLFPSGSAAPKVPISEGLFHVLIVSNPDTYIHRCMFSSPALLVGEENCIVVVGTTLILTFHKHLLHKGPLYHLSYYYAFHLTYPNCIAALLSVLQTQVLRDAIHEQDTTPSYKKAIHE